MSTGNGSGSIDFKSIADAALSQAPGLLSDWLPGGRLHGHEYKCGNLQGEPGESLSVNIKTGAWGDFATGEVGGDLIALYAAIQGVGQGEAAKKLADHLSVRSSQDFPVSRVPGTPTLTQPDVASEAGQTIILPPPGSRPNFTHLSWGEPSKIWEYRDDQERTTFFIARYDVPEKGKQFAPFSYDGKKWVMKSPPAPRPLYGLDLLKKRPKAPVIVVEGEKVADSLRTVAGHAYVVVTWPGGANALGRIDFTPLHGRKLLLWPDADSSQTYPKRHERAGQVMPYEEQPGPQAMLRLAGLLAGRAEEIKLIDVQGMPDKWDAADSTMTWDELVVWAKARAKPYVHVEQCAEPEVVGTPWMRPPPTPRGEMYVNLGISVSQQGSPYCNADNVLRVLEGLPEFDGLVWYDEFYARYLTRLHSREVRQWGDEDDSYLMVYLQRYLGFNRMSVTAVTQAVRLHAMRHVKNEPRDWLEGLKWDGIRRLEGFLSECFGGQDAPDYLESASKNWWIAMVARIYDPGCKVDNMLVLEGGEGKFKSSILKAIGGKWYGTAHESVNSKDFYLALQGKLLVEIEELDAFSKAEVTTIKKVVSCQTDRFRPPYGRAAIDFPRQCVFVGTTNETEYLKGSTGARRFWPVTVGTIDHSRVRELREQLFAEAVHRYKAGETWYEMPKESTAAAQESRRQTDAWEGAIYDWLGLRSQTTVFEVGELGLKIEAGQLDRAKQMRIASCLRYLGWQRRMVWNGSKTERMWVSPDQIQNHEFPI